jgi:hypothetical protein
VRQVVAPDLKLSGEASVEQNAGDSFLSFQIGVTWDADNAADQTYFAYAEVWGTAATGASVPVAWVGGMTDVMDRADGSVVLALQLEKEWLSRAQAAAPFTLRNVYVQVWLSLSLSLSMSDHATTGPHHTRAAVTDRVHAGRSRRGCDASVCRAGHLLQRPRH